MIAFASQRCIQPSTQRRPLPFDQSAWLKLIDSLHLTPKEAQVIAHLLQGQRDKQIAAALGVSRSTIRTRLSCLFRRLGIRNRIQLINHIFNHAHPSHLNF